MRILIFAAFFEPFKMFVPCDKSSLRAKCHYKGRIAPLEDHRGVFLNGLSQADFRHFRVDSIANLVFIIGNDKY